MCSAQCGCFLHSLISCFPGMLLRYCISDCEVVPVAPVITGVTFAFTAHMHWISTVVVVVVVIVIISTSSSNSSSSRTDTIKALGYNSIQNFTSTHTPDYIFSQSVRMLVLIRTTTYSFSTLESSWKLYLSVVRSKHEYAHLYGILYRLLTPKSWHAFSGSL